MPITVNFWPSSENGRSVVSVEYSVRDDFLGRGDDAAFVLQNLSLSLPCPSRQAPDVTQVPADQIQLYQPLYYLLWVEYRVHSCDETSVLLTACVLYCPYLSQSTHLTIGSAVRR